MNDHHDHQKRFYNHLRMHPGAHKAASAIARKLVAKDPTAVAALKDVASKASSDESAANALKIIAVTMKYEHPDFGSDSGGAMYAGGIPAVARSVGGIVKLALTPAAWVLSTGGKVFNWTGHQLQHFSHVI